MGSLLLSFGIEIRSTSNFMVVFCERLGMSKDMSTAGHPQTDGHPQSERINRVLEDYLKR